MAEPEVHIGGADAGDEGDVEMQGGDQSADVVEISETGTTQDRATGAAAKEDEKSAQRVTFVEYAWTPTIIFYIRKRTE